MAHLNVWKGEIRGGDRWVEWWKEVCGCLLPCCLYLRIKSRHSVKDHKLSKTFLLPSYTHPLNAYTSKTSHTRAAVTPYPYQGRLPIAFHMFVLAALLVRYVKGSQPATGPPLRSSFFKSLWSWYLVWYVGDGVRGGVGHQSSSNVKTDRPMLAFPFHLPPGLSLPRHTFQTPPIHIHRQTKPAKTERCQRSQAACLSPRSPVVVRR